MQARLERGKCGSTVCVLARTDMALRLDSLVFLEETVQSPLQGPKAMLPVQNPLISFKASRFLRLTLLDQCTTCCTGWRKSIAVSLKQSRHCRQGGRGRRREGQPVSSLIATTQSFFF